MNRDSIRLAMTGALIGVLALSAVLAARLSPPPVREETGPGAETVAGARLEGPPSEAAGGVFDGEAVPAMAMDAARETVSADAPETVPAGEPETVRADASEPEAGDPAAGPFFVAARIPDPIPGERLFLCDKDGCPLAALDPDRDGDAAAGPLAPGRYGVWRGETEIGFFRLRNDAALEEAEGRLWTDGELLWVERYVPGALRLTLRLPGPGYYAFRLCDRNGRSWSRDLYLAEGTPPDEAGVWIRTLEFRGLAPELYTVIYGGGPLGQAEVRAGETAGTEFTIDK